MIFKNTKKAKHGFALSIVLWIVAALMLVALLVALFSKDTVTLSSGIKQKLQARLEANSVLEMLKFYIGTANYNNTSLLNDRWSDLGITFPSEITLDGRWYQLTPHKRFRITDSSAVFSVFALNSYVFARYLSEDTVVQNSILDSLLDWVDADHEIRLSGAESHYYQREKGVPYHPSNLYRLQHPKELELIRGIDSLSPLELEKMHEKSYFADGRQVNLALLDERMLAAHLEISLSHAQTLVALRTESLQNFAQELRGINGYYEEAMGFAISKQFIIEIEVEHKNAKALLKTIIDFKPTEHLFYTVIDEQNY